MFNQMDHVLYQISNHCHIQPIETARQFILHTIDVSIRIVSSAEFNRFFRIRVDIQWDCIIDKSSAVDSLSCFLIKQDSFTYRDTSLEFQMVTLIVTTCKTLLFEWTLDWTAFWTCRTCEKGHILLTIHTVSRWSAEEGNAIWTVKTSRTVDTIDTFIWTD